MDEHFKRSLELAAKGEKHNTVVLDFWKCIAKRQLGIADQEPVTRETYKETK